MTDIPGTSSPQKNNSNEALSKKINLETIVNIKSIRQSRAKPTSLTFDNINFRNWIIFTTILVTLFVIYLSFTSYKFLILIFSGPGIGVVSFSIKESVRKHLKDNDSFIRRY